MKPPYGQAIVCLITSKEGVVKTWQCTQPHGTMQKSLKTPKGGNQSPYIEEEQTMQWSKEKGQKDKQRSTKHTHKTKDGVTRTPITQYYTVHSGTNDTPQVVF
jgi:hypothetical protein